MSTQKWFVICSSQQEMSPCLFFKTVWPKKKGGGPSKENKSKGSSPLPEEDSRDSGFTAFSKVPINIALLCASIAGYNKMYLFTQSLSKQNGTQFFKCSTARLNSEFFFWLSYES